MIYIYILLMSILININYIYCESLISTNKPDKIIENEELFLKSLYGKKVKGNVWIITDIYNKIIKKAFIFEISTGIVFDSDTKLLADIFKINIDINNIIKANIIQITNNIEYFDLLQVEGFPRGWKPVNLYDISRDELLIYYNTEKLYQKVLPTRVSYQTNIRYLLGNIWVVYSPGYYPEIIYQDYTKPPEGEWYEFNITLKEWPERMEQLKNRPYVESNFILQVKTPEYWEARESIFGRLCYGDDPLKTLYEEKVKLRDMALRMGNYKDAAWLSYAVAISPYSKRRGYDRTAGDLDLLNGNFYTVRKEMLKMYPDSQTLQAWFDYYKMMITSPVGLQIQDGKGVVYFDTNYDFDTGLEKLRTTVKALYPGRTAWVVNENTNWTQDDVLHYINYAKKYESDPLWALNMLDITETVGFMASTNVHELYYSNKMYFLGKLLEKYPSVFWLNSEYILKYAHYLTNGPMPWTNNKSVNIYK